MQTIDFILIGLGVMLLLAGYIIGFGKSLKVATGGIAGVIISIFICAAFGGMVLGTRLVSGWISALNAKLAAVWSFLGKIQAGVIIFYIVFFALVQAARVATVKVICEIFETDKKAMKVVNRALGMIFLPALAFTFLLLLLAVIRLFDGSAAVNLLLSKTSGSILAKLYHINPITLHL